MMIKQEDFIEKLYNRCLTKENGYIYMSNDVRKAMDRFKAKKEYNVRLDLVMHHQPFIVILKDEMKSSSKSHSFNLFKEYNLNYSVVEKAFYGEEVDFILFFKEFERIMFERLLEGD